MKEKQLLILRSDSHGKPTDRPGTRIPRPTFNWKTRILVPAVVLGGFLVLGVLSAYEHLMPAVTVHAASVVAKKAQGNTAGKVAVQAAGWMEANPYKSYITALTDGVVREVLVLEGQPVARGQVVVRLVDEDARLAVQRAKHKVKELEATVALEKAELRAAKTDWENPVERTRAVAASQAQLAESKATVSQISSEIEVEESNLEHAKSQYDRAVALKESGSVSEQEFVRLRSVFHAQISKVAALKNRHAAVKELAAKHEADLQAAQQHMQLRTEERRKLDRAQAAVMQAEAALEQARTALAESELRLARTEIRSPMDGVVMSRMTEPGSKVVILSDNPGSARVLSLYDPTRLQVRVDVPLADAGKISVGQQAEITAEVIPDRAFSGTVTRILHEANIQKNTLEVKVALAEPDPTLRPEMLARVKFLAKPDPEAAQDAKRLFAPEVSVLGKGSQATAWVVRDFDGHRGIAVPVAVRSGTSRIDTWIDVIEGLQQGDVVITSPASALKAGARVKVLLD
ncbi:MAG: efflux RND transporter periplasmic adaptor subunit [Thermodesulfobacteriota bacterium]